MADDGLVREQLTMLMTLRMHARDALSPRPILGDAYAADVLERAGHPVREGVLPDGNVYAICARARLVDRVVSAFLADHPDAVVVHLGCGLDSRVLRVDPGPEVAWFEVDQEPVIAMRDRLYDARPGVTTLATRVEDAAWWEQLPDDRPRLLVAEGLLMYLDPPMVDTVLRHGFAGAGPRELVADTVAPWVAAAARLHPVIGRAGARFRSTTSDLTRAAGDRGLERRTPQSVAREAARRTSGPTSLFLRGFDLVPVVGHDAMLVDHWVREEPA